jgi:hypothetical protein
MQKDFFEKQIERLGRVYSKASLSQDRAQVLWESFKLIDNDRFEAAVNNLIGECTTQQLPALSRFYDAVANSRKSSITANIGAVDWCCSCCDQSGLIFAKRKDTKLEEIFSCGCFFTKQKAVEKYPQWDISHAKTHDPHFWDSNAGSTRYKIPFKPDKPQRTAEEQAAIDKAMHECINSMRKGVTRELPYNPQERGELKSESEVIDAVDWTV